MPRLRVIVLEQPDARTYRVALWADVPPAFQPAFAAPAFVSAWKQATPADVGALQSGAVTEMVTTLVLEEHVPDGIVRDRLETLWSEFQAHIRDRNPFRTQNASWNGVTWIGL